MQPSNNNRPTWYKDIQDYFTLKEIDTIQKEYRIHLGTYADVVQHMDTILELVRNGKLSQLQDDTKLQLFKIWKRNGFTIGYHHFKPKTYATRSLKKSTRIRKNLADLTEQEIIKLRKAFNGIKNRDKDPNSKQSYFALAGVHWYPSHSNPKWNDLAGGLYCHHHIPRYNPWHRAYLYEFENALRSVEGCEDVTLPYWDFENISSLEAFFPKILEEAPFNEYKFPFDIAQEDEIKRELESDIAYRIKSEEKKIEQEIGGEVSLTKEEQEKIRIQTTKEYQESKYYKKGYRTTRNLTKCIFKYYSNQDASECSSSRLKFNMHQKVKNAMEAYSWDNFHNFRSNTAIIGAHDSGHNAIGPTMANQSISAFDPIFWFFHCNWDRLWWKWQQDHNATTLENLLNHIGVGFRHPDAVSKSREIFKDDLLKTLPPFQLRTTDLVDSANQLDIDYIHPSREYELSTVSKLGSTYNNNALNLDLKNTSIRIKNLNRLSIPGSFNISLKGTDGNGKKTTIDTIGFFQPNQVGQCENCVANARTHFDFIVPTDAIKGKTLSIDIESSNGQYNYNHALEGTTINARFLAIQE